MDIATIQLLFTGITMVGIVTATIIAKKKFNNQDLEKCNKHSERINTLETKIPYLEQHISSINNNIKNIYDIFEKRTTHDTYDTSPR